MQKWFLIIVFFTFPIVAMAQSWELKKSADGIEVYTRKLNNDRYKEIKVVSELNGSAERLTKILQDVNHHKDWAYGTKSSYILSRKNQDTLYYYTEVELPWPMTNRDLVIQLSCWQISPTVLRIEARSIPNMLSLKPNLIRVPYSLGVWNIITVPGNRLKIEYTFSVNPGGALPAWLINYTATTGPFNTFKNLKEKLK